MPHGQRCKRDGEHNNINIYVCVRACVRACVCVGLQFGFSIQSFVPVVHYGIWLYQGQKSQRNFTDDNEARRLVTSLVRNYATPKFFNISLCLDLSEHMSASNY